MRQVTGSLGTVVKGMDKAMESMNLEKVSPDYIIWCVVVVYSCGNWVWWRTGEGTCGKRGRRMIWIV